MGKDFKVVVTDPERAALFEEIFGSKIVNVMSPIPEWAYLPGHDEPKEVYALDLELIEEARIEKLIQHIAQKFNQPVALVREGIYGEHGVPILKEHCAVIIENPQRWLD